jgi:hypothetical protein
MKVLRPAHYFSGIKRERERERDWFPCGGDVAAKSTAVLSLVADENRPGHFAPAISLSLAGFFYWPLRAPVERESGFFFVARAAPYNRITRMWFEQLDPGACIIWSPHARGIYKKNTAAPYSTVGKKRRDVFATDILGAMKSYVFVINFDFCCRYRQTPPSWSCRFF